MVEHHSAAHRHPEEYKHGRVGHPGGVVVGVAQTVESRLVARTLADAVEELAEPLREPVSSVLLADLQIVMVEVRVGPVVDTA